MAVIDISKCKFFSLHKYDFIRCLAKIIGGLKLHPPLFFPFSPSDRFLMKKVRTVCRVFHIKHPSSNITRILAKGEGGFLFRAQEHDNNSSLHVILTPTKRVKEEGGREKLSVCVCVGGFGGSLV